LALLAAHQGDDLEYFRPGPPELFSNFVDEIARRRRIHQSLLGKLKGVACCQRVDKVVDAKPPRFR
jgi:hypothetical protein